MTDNERQLREALHRINEVINQALGGEEPRGGEPNGDYGEDQAPAPAPAEDAVACTPKVLPQRLLMKAAEVAVQINPVNAPALGPLAALGPGFAEVMDPMHLAVLTAKYWGSMARRLTVSFMESTPADLRARIVSHMNAWSQRVGISFVETQGVGNVRISRGPGGYWSYLGTDIRLIPTNRPTMNLQGFTMSTPESEYRRVVRHETGHTMGFPHEHMRQALVARIDPQKAYDYFRRTQGWDPRTVDQQVLTPLDERSIMATPADQTSIMCYQLPASITRDGKPILGGVDINATDYAFAARIYPKPGSAPVVGSTPLMAYADDWDESEDVEVEV
jgi:hypothetical protein